MKKIQYLILALLCLVAQGALADSTFGGGDGSAKNPYIISTTAHWDQLASDVNGGTTTYSGTYFQLGADITVTTMVGKNKNRFQGKFDGNGRTITFNYTATEDYCAPFCRISGATIKNLHTEGTIETAYCYAAGIVAYTRYYSKIENCSSSVIIKSSHAGWSGHGGIMALKAWVTQSEPTIEGCLFDGKILTTGTTAETKTTGCGGIVGFTNGQTLTIKDCIYKPAALADGETAVACSTLYENSTSKASTVTCTNSYYFTAYGATQGKQARSIGFDDGVDIDVVPKGDATDYNVSGITGYDGNQCVKFNDVVYAGSGDEVELTFRHHYAGVTVSDYAVISGDGATMTGNDTDGYTLTMGDADVIFGYTMSGNIPTIAGKGTSDAPFEIGSSVVWDYFVSLIDNDKTYKDADDNVKEYATAYYKLTEDITVTTMMGFDGHRFSGHFDGGGKTLTVNYDTDEQYAAPFRYIDGAEISNLRVAGTIKTSKKFAAGFVANAQGINEIENCRSSVTINSSVSGDGTHGGFVAHNLSGYFYMKGCAFDGSMLGSSTNNCGGFVGWNETSGSSTGAVYFENCFFAPTSITVELEHTYARSRTNDGAHVQMYYSNCRTNIGDNQQYRVYSISAGNGVTIEVNQTVVNEYSVSGITIYNNNSGMMYDGVHYTRNEQSMSLNLGYTGTGTLTGFTTTSGTLSGEGNPFTLTMGTGDAIINATTGSGSGWSGSGSGISSDPYIISTSDEWNEFAYKVDNGVFGFNSAYYKLSDDIDGITVTTMVGTEDHRFKGHFDGNSKTLTVSYGTAESRFNEDYCAPFRHIENADIHNLNVAGTIYTQKQFAAGLAGLALNDNTFTDCRSSVTINSSVNGDGTHGGFVANCKNNLDRSSTVTFTNCAFNGSFVGAKTNSWGGFAGWTEGKDWANVRTVGCLFAPAGLNVDSYGSAIFSRGPDKNWSHIIIEDSYYTQHLGTLQGTMAYSTPPANVTSEAKTIAGITVYVRNTVVTDVTATDITPTTATISWKGTDACSNYQLRYREKGNADVYATSFEDGMPDDWTAFDNDGDDEHSWTYSDGSIDDMAHSGSSCVYSASYINNYGSLTPDNWLVSPQIDLSGTLKLWLKGQDSNDYREHFAIYLTTSATGSKDDFLDADGKVKEGVITLVPETETTSEYQEYIADLSAYKGKKGYIAIRHFNCRNQYFLVLDDFLVYNDDLSGDWFTVSGSSPAGTKLEGLTPGTTYEYQVKYDYSSNTYYTPTMILTTLAEDVAPTDLSATAITANTATISWTGYAQSYNLRCSNGGMVKVTLSVPEEIWDDGSGYQMLLDIDHNTYGYNSVIPTTGGMSGDAEELAAKYALFEYKIPEGADSNLSTSNMLNGREGKRTATITIPSGTYDWCITNPTPNDRMWIASERGNVGGRQNDFFFEVGKHYTFTVTLDNNSGNDHVDMTVEDDEDLVTGDEIEVTGITSTSYNLSGLDASTYYAVYVQSVKGDKTSEWSCVSFSTLKEGELYLYDNQVNSGIIAANSNKQFNMTLQGRTLYKDGNWNTLCLPFNVSVLEGSPLEGATVMELDTKGEYSGHKTGFDGETLYLYFKTATAIEAGKPYLVKWTNDDTDITNPTFNLSEIKAASPVTVTSADSKVSFRGTYNPVSISGNSYLFLSTGNNLYWPSTTMTINAFRAYFQLNGISAGEPANVRLYFGDDEATGIETITMNHEPRTDGEWYDLSGRKMATKPTAKGVYIYNGKKRVMK